LYTGLYAFAEQKPSLRVLMLFAGVAHPAEAEIIIHTSMSAA
jgi:hypothetical protein